MDELQLDVAADSRWIPLLTHPEDTDVDEWAEGMAREALRIRGMLAPSAMLLETATAVIAGLARNIAAEAEQYPVVGAWALVPGPDVVPEALARLRPMFPPAAVSREQVVDDLVAPAGERYGEPKIDVLDTASGEATRVVQRLVRRDEQSGRDIVEESLAYVWWLPEGETALVLSTFFLDLVEGGRWRPDCDDLARLVHARVA